MFGLLSQYWMDEHRADGEVLLINRIEQQPSCGFSREHVVARVPIHCIVASSASTYFSALLSPAWHQQESQHQQTATVRLVLGDVADIAAMLALLKCLYTGALDVNDADLYATLQPDSGRCSSAVRECLSSSHWQQLYLRVIKLADQYAVHGVMDVAVSKLTNLFSHQLEWSTIEAVLWMPASISREPRMAALKHLAVSGVRQKLGVLDTALAQPSGRHMLQALPPDVLAAILSYDTLAATSENTVLAAVDIWSAGPVAHALALQPDHPVYDHASCYDSSPSSSRSSSSASSQFMILEGSGDSEEMHSTGQSPLLAALTLLLDSVRLNQCSGAFLAAAVGHMPWLCNALQHKAGDLQLLQQYYSSDSEGRYELSMHLIQQTISCPWQPKLRKALPAGYNSSSRADQPGTFTLLSEVRTLLDTTIKQQLTQKVHLFQAMCSPSAAPPGVLLSEFVMGGYQWHLSLVGAPYRRTRTQIAAAADGDGTEQQRQQLAICIICRPAWAANLNSLSSSSSAAAGGGRTDRPPVTADPVAVAAATRLLGQGPATVPDCECATGSARRDADVALPAAAAAAEGLGVNLGSRCSVCRSLCGIAMSRSAAAVDRHLPEGLARTVPKGGSSSSSSSKDRSPWSYAQDVVVGVNVTAAPSAPLLQALLSVNAGKPPAEAHTAVRLAWSDTARAAYGLIPLDVLGIGNSSSNLVCGWACEGKDLPAGAVHPAVTTNSAAAAMGPAAADAMAAAAGVDGGVGGGGSSLVVGWQPELWSRVAYTGGLHWHSSLRLLSD